MAWNLGYWSQVFKRILYILFIIIGLFLCLKLAVFYTPFLIAFVISLLMEPAIKFIMKKLKLSRKISSIIVFIITFGIIIGSLIWGIVTLISESSNLLQGFNNYFEKAYIQIQNIINSFNLDKIEFSKNFSNIIQESSGDILFNISEFIKGILTKFVNIITSLPTFGIYLVITILSLYFICTDKIYILDTFEHHMPRAWVKKVGIHCREIINTLGCYLKAELILILVSFIISLIGLYIFKIIGLNIEYPLLIGLGIAFVDALPILGSGTIMIPWAIISALDGDLHLGIAVIVLWIIMSLVRQFLEPKLVSNKIGIHPIFTLIAMYTGFKVIGIIGMFIGPILLIIFRNVFSTLIDKGVIKMIFDKN